VLEGWLVGAVKIVFTSGAFSVYDEKDSFQIVKLYFVRNRNFLDRLALKESEALGPVTVLNDVS
jgi:hypothetical protein